jgi:cell division protein FtsL
LFYFVFICFNLFYFVVLVFYFLFYFIVILFILFILFCYITIYFICSYSIFTINSRNEPIEDKNRSRMALKRPVAGLGKDGKKCKSVTCMEPPSKAEKS